MGKINSFIEFLLFWLVKFFAAFIRLLPVSLALWIGRMVGNMVYYFDVKHKSQAYANLKVAFSKTKTPNDIKRITKELFQNYGQGLIELCRLPLMTPENFDQFVKIDGKQHVLKALEKDRGVILLVMHYGSWELASLSFAMLGSPYKVIVKPQKKFKRLDELLNSYRSCRGSVVVSRGFGTREAIRGLKDNEIIAMVVDQGGRDGVLVPFFGRTASMSVGALRMALKLGTPICFAVISREDKHQHRLVIHKPFDLVNTGNIEEDIPANLQKVTKVMEHHIEASPSEYMWFYKIWKYSNRSQIMILSDEKIGHLRQSQAVGRMIQKALSERGIVADTKMIEVKFKNRFFSQLLSVLSFMTHPRLHQGRLEFLKWFLDKESFLKVMSVKADFIVSCGSSLAGLNYLLSLDHRAKNIAVLKPGILNFEKFDLIILPEHDGYSAEEGECLVTLTQGAPNLVNEQYLTEQAQLLKQRFEHLQYRQKFTIGVFLGGDSRHSRLEEGQVRIVLNQIKEAAAHLDADILLTTSRRTPLRIVHILKEELMKHPRCQVLILANDDNIPEAVGGILGLSNVVVVSGDSVSMISEAASSGKSTIIFSLSSQKTRKKNQSKHERFIDQLHSSGYVLSAGAGHVSSLIQEVAKNKIRTVQLNDNERILKAVRKII